MHADKLTYIEECGLYFEGIGMPRMAGRVFGYLLVSDRDAASFEEIRAGLNASKGSISGTVKQLVQVAFVEVVSLPGDRKTYYRVSRMPIGNLLRSRLKAFREFSLLLAKANDLKERDDTVSEWITETSSFYDWIEARMEEMIDRWEVEKNGIIKQPGRS
jgi:DNA-binding transcriptional regulator GbsR (MarR family)